VRMKYILITTALAALLLTLPINPDAQAADLGEIIRQSRSDEAPPARLFNQSPLYQEVGRSVATGDPMFTGVGGDVLKPMLMSLVLPGLGEVSMGHKRGYVLMALDVFSWFKVKQANDDGNDLKTEYLAYADDHWSLDKLQASFDINLDFHPGFDYYNVSAADSLSLWVSRADDEREYYENLGKWDQFVFGWDDFIDPRSFPEVGADATTADLRDPRVSANRETYRGMRIAANDKFDRRDLYIKLNMVSRVVSMLQVAWLSGAFGNDGSDAMEFGGHRLSMITETRGLTGGRLGLSLSY
jgi:hypothetical protein